MIRWQVLIAREIVVASLLLIAITSVPYLFGYVQAPAGKWFSGIVFNVHDTAQYLSWMRESGSRVLIENKLTSEPNPPVFVNLHWWIPGRAAAILGLTSLDVYQPARVAAIILYVAVVHWMVRQFYSDERRRRYAFWLTTLTSGLGWLWIVDKYIRGLQDPRWPNDVYTTPGNSLWVMVASPHLTLALALTLLTLGLAWLSIQRQSNRLALAAAGVALFLALGHIYDLVTIWAVLAVYTMLLTLRYGWRWRVVAKLALIVGGSAPAAVYFGWISSSANPTWQQALVQYDNLGVFTPTPWHLVILLGVTFALSIVRLAQLFGQAIAHRAKGFAGPDNRTLFLCSWFTANLIVIYLPLRFQIMLLTGFQFVMAVLATDFIYGTLIPRLMVWAANRKTAQVIRLFRRLTALTPALILVMVIPTNLYLISWRVFDLHRANPPFYLNQDDTLALWWLEEHARPHDVVLSALDTGYYVPGLTGAHAYYASAVMTLDFSAKRAQVEGFFSGQGLETQRCMFMGAENIRFVFWGDSERQLGTYDPSGSSYLEPVFTSPKTTVFEYQPGRCP